jgi:hypothetical protein
MSTLLLKSDCTRALIDPTMSYDREEVFHRVGWARVIVGNCTIFISHLLREDMEPTWRQGLPV